VSGENTNTALYRNCLLAPYVINQVNVYRCPGDFIQSQNGQRIRSYSMNSQMGDYWISNPPGVPNTGESWSYNPGWMTFDKNSDLAPLGAANGWVFADEAMYSMNDGYLQMNCSQPLFPDVPANYHGKTDVFSFADGHVENHKWAFSTLQNVPYTYGVTGQNVSTSGADKDWLWLRNHASLKVQ
jgi:hypothetical protein